MQQRKRLGEILRELGVLTDGELQSALRIQQQKPMPVPLGKLLLDHLFVDREPLFKALAKQFHLPFVHLGNEKVHPEVIRVFPRVMLKRVRVLPLKFLVSGNKKRLVVACDDPSDPSLVRTLRVAARMEVLLVLTTPEDLEQARIRHGIVEDRRLDLPPDDGEPMKFV